MHKEQPQNYHFNHDESHDRWPTIGVYRDRIFLPAVFIQRDTRGEEVSTKCTQYILGLQAFQFWVLNEHGRC